MFSNGKFKNVVAEINESLLIKPGEHHRKIYSLLPIRGTKSLKSIKLPNYIIQRIRRSHEELDRRRGLDVVQWTRQ